MAFTLPLTYNTHVTAPASNPQWNSTQNTPTSAGVKSLGSLPIANNAGDWERDPDASTAAAGYNYDFYSNFSVANETKLLVWHTQSNAPNRIQKNTVQQAGTQVRIYSGTGSPPTEWIAFNVGGNDTPASSSVSGHYPFVIDMNDTTSPDDSSGTYDNTDVSGYGLWCNNFAMTGGATMWCYESPLYVFDTTKSSANTPFFSGAGSSVIDIVTEVNGTDYTNKKGNWVRKIGSVIFIDVAFKVGDNSSNTSWTDSGFTIISPPTNDTADPRNRLTTQACRFYINLRNNASDVARFNGTWQWGTRAPFDFDQDDNAKVILTNPTFKGMGAFTLGSSVTGPATWDNVDEVIFADTGVDVDGSTFKNTNGNHALEMTAGAMNIANMRFESYAGAHAILIDTAGTYEFDNVFFDQSGTNDVENTSGGLVTINVVNGGTVPTITNTGGGSTTTVNNNVTLNVIITDTDAVAIQNAMVEVTATETVGTITDGDVLLKGLTAANGAIANTALNYEAAFDPSGLDIQIKARQGTTSPYKKPAISTGTVSSSGFETTIALIADE